MLSPFRVVEDLYRFHIGKQIAADRVRSDTTQVEHPISNKETIREFSLSMQKREREQNLLPAIVPPYWRCRE